MMGFYGTRENKIRGKSANIKGEKEMYQKIAGFHDECVVNDAKNALFRMGGAVEKFGDGERCKDLCICLWLTKS